MEGVMQEINLPRNVIKSAEQRWARTFAREALAWKERSRKLRLVRTALTSGRSSPYDIRNPSSLEARLTCEPLNLEIAKPFSKTPPNKTYV